MTKRVLVVDDDPDIRRVVMRLLTRAGYEVAQARNGDDALAYLAHGGVADAIVSDGDMPKFSGLQMYALLSDATRRRVVFFSGRIEQFAGIDRPVIGKTDLTGLLAAVRAIIEETP